MSRSVHLREQKSLEYLLMYLCLCVICSVCRCPDGLITTQAEVFPHSLCLDGCLPDGQVRETLWRRVWQESPSKKTERRRRERTGSPELLRRNRTILNKQRETSCRFEQLELDCRGFTLLWTVCVWLWWTKQPKPAEPNSNKTTTLHLQNWNWATSTWWNWVPAPPPGHFEPVLTVTRTTGFFFKTSEVESVEGLKWSEIN